MEEFLASPAAAPLLVGAMVFLGIIGAVIIHYIHVWMNRDDNAKMHELMRKERQRD